MSSCDPGKRLWTPTQDDVCAGAVIHPTAAPPDLLQLCMSKTANVQTAVYNKLEFIAVEKAKLLSHLEFAIIPCSVIQVT